MFTYLLEVGIISTFIHINYKKEFVDMVLHDPYFKENIWFTESDDKHKLIVSFLKKILDLLYEVCDEIEINHVIDEYLKSIDSRFSNMFKIGLLKDEIYNYRYIESKKEKEESKISFEYKTSESRNIDINDIYLPHMLHFVDDESLRRRNKAKDLIKIDSYYKQINKELKPFIQRGSIEKYKYIFENKCLPNSKSFLKMISKNNRDIIRFADCFDLNLEQAEKIFKVSLNKKDKPKYVHNAYNIALKKIQTEYLDKIKKLM